MKIRQIIEKKSTVRENLTPPSTPVPDANTIAQAIFAVSSYGDGQDGDILYHAQKYLERNLKVDTQKSVNLIYKTPLGNQIVDIYHQLRRQPQNNMNEGEVVKGRFGQKFVPTLGRTIQTSPYQRNPDIEIPEYDPAKNRVWREGISASDSREPFESFETRRSDLGTATHIIGITQSGQRVQISTTTSEELAQVLADAYNRGGFTDKNIERVSLSPEKE